MNAHKTMMIMSVVFVICIAIAILGTLTLYGTITRIDAQPVLVDGHQYPNADVAGIMILIRDGFTDLALLPYAPLTAIPALVTTTPEIIINKEIITLIITACAIFGALLSGCLLVLEIRRPSAG